jgi:L-fuculose-phosphate aldolase
LSLAAEKAKEQIAKMGQKIIAAGLVFGTWGNISVRVAKEELVVITPSGIDYGNIQARDMVVVDYAGQVVEGERRPSNETQMHLAIYRARNDVGAVMHTHSVFASAMAVAQTAIPPIMEDMAQLIGGGVPVARYARAATAELAANAVEALGELNAVLLANHGVVGVGRDLNEAFDVCQVVERSAQVYAWAGLNGRPAELPARDIEALRSAYLTTYSKLRKTSC